MPIDKSGIARASAQILLDTKSVLFNAREPFIFTSGRASPVYTDCRRLISFPEERGILMDFGANMLREYAGGVDLVAGGETAGIPYAAFIAERLNKPMLYVRKKPKGFGKMAQIEGVMDEEGKRVVLVEDMQSDGASKKVFYRRPAQLRRCGRTHFRRLPLRHLPGQRNQYESRRCYAACANHLLGRPRRRA